MSATIVTNLDGLKRMSMEFYDALETATDDEAEAGFKCFALAYLGLKEERPGDEVQALALLSIMSRIYMEFEFGIKPTPRHILNGRLAA
jgi:hypothetical protein